jgi:hypothetical protein
MNSNDPLEELQTRIPLTAALRERWERFTYNRGYGKGAFLRSFIEAVTDPARGPRIEQIMRETPEPGEVEIRR